MVRAPGSADGCRQGCRQVRPRVRQVGGPTGIRGEVRGARPAHARGRSFGSPRRRGAWRLRVHSGRGDIRDRRHGPAQEQSAVAHDYVPLPPLRFLRSAADPVVEAAILDVVVVEPFVCAAVVATPAGPSDQVPQPPGHRVADSEPPSVSTAITHGPEPMCRYVPSAAVTDPVLGATTCLLGLSSSPSQVLLVAAIVMAFAYATRRSNVGPCPAPGADPPSVRHSLRGCPQASGVR